MASLDDLVARYLSPAATPHCENSSVEFVVDGRVWMRRMRDLLTSLGPGGAAYGDGRTGPPPLSNRVLLDWSGSGVGSNHQKITLVRRGSELTACAGGMGYAASRVDESPHRRLAVRGGRWGWHDAGAMIRGPAAIDVCRTVGMRWIGAVSLPRRRYVWPAVKGLQILNPPGMPAEITAPPPQAARAAPGSACQILRSVGHRPAAAPAAPQHRPLAGRTPDGARQDRHH